MRHQYRQSGNPVRGHKDLRGIFILVEFHFENCFRNHQIAPCHKRIEKAYLMRHQYRQSGRGHEDLGEIFIDI